MYVACMLHVCCMDVAWMLHVCCMYVTRALRRSAGPALCPTVLALSPLDPALSAECQPCPRALSCVPPSHPTIPLPSPPTIPDSPPDFSPLQPPNALPSDHSCPPAIPTDRLRSHVWLPPPAASSRAPIAPCPNPVLTALLIPLPPHTLQ